MPIASNWVVHVRSEENNHQFFFPLLFLYFATVISHFICWFVFILIFSFIILFSFSYFIASKISLLAEVDFWFGFVFHK